MPEKVNDKTVYSLFEVTQSIRKTISERYKSFYWVKAEMNKLNLQPSGRCYPELVEKKNRKIITKIGAIIWENDYNVINRNFLRIAKEPLKDGIKILFRTKITFDLYFGLQLTIKDIDPIFSLGELEKEKFETIAKLKIEGIYNKNKELAFPLLPKRIAIISAETSSGYLDFKNVIEEYSKDYILFQYLFPATLDGDNAINSIIYQLTRIRKVKHHFDAVAIIRGGGGAIGLSCYNNFQLSKEVALFPIPVMTGIGHSTNKTVVELISYKDAITPTKLGEFIVQKFQDFSEKVRNAQEVITTVSNKIIRDEKVTLHHQVKYSRSIIKNRLINFDNEINNEIRALYQQTVFLFRREWESNNSIVTNIKKIVPSFYSKVRENIKDTVFNMRKDVISNITKSRLLLAQNHNQVKKYQKDFLLSSSKKIKDSSDRFFEKVTLYLRSKNNELSNIEKIINYLNPKNQLQRGYSISLHNGKALRSIQQVQSGDKLETLIIDGKIISNIKTVKKMEEQ